MKFISLCDYSGFVKTELFAAVYKAFGMETIKSPLIELEGFVEPFENKKGYTLRVQNVPRLERTGGVLHHRREPDGRWWHERLIASSLQRSSLSSSEERSPSLIVPLLFFA